MKKITLIMALIAALSLASCGKEEKKPEKPTLETNVETKVDENVEEGTDVEADMPTEDEVPMDTPEVEKPSEEQTSTPSVPQQNVEKPAEQPKPTEPQKPAEQPKPTEPQKPVEQPKPTEPQKPAEQPKPAEPQKDTRSLNEIMSSILVGMGETPMLGEIPLDAETFEFYTFVPFVEGAEGLVSEPMMGSFAHSVVLVRLPDGADVKDFASRVKANANPRKWICVEAEEVKVSTKGNLVLLVMSSSDNVGVISSNFLK